MSDECDPGESAPNVTAPGTREGPGTVATVRTAIAPINAEPRVSSPQVSQQLSGHVVRVLESESDWRRVRGEDGYEGWVHSGYLDLGPGAGVVRRDRLLSLGCVARARGTGARRALPLGAWLAAGEDAVVGEAIDEAVRARTFPRDAEAITATALERFGGTPYQWGGITPWGADCSGLVQSVFWLHGVSLPRDAWQQAEAGTDAGRVLADLRPADLLFFSERTDRRITHVGMALGRSRMVHLALGRGGYAVERLDAGDDAYVAALVRRFSVARRLL